RVAVEYRQRQRRAAADDAIGNVKQLRQAEALEAGERGQVHVGIELRLGRLDAVGGGLDLGAGTGDVGTPSEQVGRQRGRQREAVRGRQPGAREVAAAVRAGADQVGELVARQIDVGLDEGESGADQRQLPFRLLDARGVLQSRRHALLRELEDRLLLLEVVVGYVEQ